MTDIRSNLLIDTLPAGQRENLLSRLEPVTLANGTPLYDHGEVPKYAHFITSGIASIVTTMADGSSAEVGIIGYEGVVEALHLLGGANVATRSMMQLPGSALRMPFREFQQEYFSSPVFQQRILQFVQVQCCMLGQIAGCHRLHDAEERLARWLLTVADRVNGETMLLTHEFLANMLGARRTTVALAAGALQRSGLIEYSRGRVRILDREELELSACECYGITRDLFKNLYQ